jgi:tRNA1(Val) A37 N6-methylase TrmN6
MNSSRAETDGREVSLDALLGGRVRLLQPKGGLRAAIDPVLLAASVPAEAGESVLEVGCGSGAAALCLAARVPDVQVTGLDLQADLVALAQRGADLNRVADRVSFVAGDLLDPPPALSERAFDHVMANPPFARAGSGRISPDPGKALASIEGPADLAAWVAVLFAAAALETVVFPLGPKRVLVQGNKKSMGSVTYMSGLDLHQPDGRFSPEADAILRGGGALMLASH